MAPPYLRRLLLEYGEDLASKAYLYADPFTRPRSLEPGAYTVSDPSYDERSAVELAAVKPLPRPVTLAEMKDSPALKGLEMIRQGRLSVSPVRDAEWAEILKVAGA